MTSVSLPWDVLPMRDTLRRSTLKYRILRVVAFIVARVTSRLEPVGLQNLPDKPPYLLVTNHLSALDTPLLLAVLPHTIRPFVASKHRSNPLYGPILEAGGAVWVRRGEIDRQALRQALAVLARGEVLGVAPEGTRARESHALQEGKAGAAYLATRADVPIMPVGIVGTEKIKNNLLRLRRTHVVITFGEPFRLREAGHVRTQKLHEYTDLIMRRIAELLPEAYRGVYA